MFAKRGPDCIVVYEKMTLLYIRFITLVKRFLISLFSQLIVPNLLQYSMMLDLYIVVQFEVK